MEKILNNRFNDYVFNLRRSFIGVNLIVAYHSGITSPYYNPILPDAQWKEQTFAFLVLKGSIKFLVQEKQLVVKEGYIVFGKSDGGVVLVDDANDAEFLCFHFQLFNYVLPLYAPYPVGGGESARAAFEDMLSCMRMQSDLGIGSANAIFMDMLFGWLRSIRATASDKIPHGKEMFDAQLYINEHVEEKLSVAALATKYNFCEKHFRALFEKVLGCPPKQYIQRVKIERAYALLKNTTLSVAEIADRLQYASPHHLSNVFKKEYGISPTECRKST